MDQAFDRPPTETCAKTTLGGRTRTGVLLMGAALACILSVDLPIPAGRAGDGQGPAQGYVPTSDRWIELGPSADPQASRPPDPLALPPVEGLRLRSASQQLLALPIVLFGGEMHVHPADPRCGPLGADNAATRRTVA